ncbi:hypothetical protein BDV18DRAFT_142238 [Aspergillus unguis]
MFNRIWIFIIALAILLCCDAALAPVLEPALASKGSRISVHTFDKPNCEGDERLGDFASGPTGLNLSSSILIKSFKTSRKLKKQEQLDFSTNPDMDAWKNHKGEENGGCGLWTQSFWTDDKVYGCTNVIPSTCMRIWINEGL